MCSAHSTPTKRNIMPNYCSNQMVINNPTEDVRALIREAVASGDFLASLFPVAEMTDEVCEGLYDNDPIGYKACLELVDGYGKCILGWGTKWDAMHVELDEHKDKVVLSFVTAYSPPIPFYERMRKEHGWSIQASYEEGGADFAGKYDNGNLTQVEYSDIAAYCNLFQTDEHPEMQGFAVVKEDGQIYYDDQFVGVLISKYQWLPCGEETMNACVLQDNGRSVALSEWELEDLGVM
jgi:hypothetical protein